MKTLRKRNEVGFKPLIQNLNRKFFVIPPGISISADDSNDSEGGTHKRSIVGMRGFLDKAAINKGVVNLTSVNVYWWIQPEDFIKKNDSLLGGDGGSKGHVAVIHKGEVYMRPTPSNLWLQKFSILVGGNQVFLYIEPLGTHVRAEITRSTLKVNGKDLPLEEIAFEFKEKMPKALQNFMESKLGDDSSRSFKERLKHLMEKIRIPRFRKSEDGKYFAESESSEIFYEGAGDGPGQGEGGTGPVIIHEDGKDRGTREILGDGGGAELKETFYNKEGGKNRAVKDDRSKDYPTIIWLSRNPQDSNIGQREEGDMEDRIGRYIMSTNTLFINADFRLIQAVTNYWKKKLDVSSPTEVTVIRRAVHSSYELTLADAIIHTRYLARTDGKKGWKDEDVGKLLGDEMVLTAIASGMFHATSTLKNEIKHDLGRIGSR